MTVNGDPTDGPGSGHDDGRGDGRGDGPGFRSDTEGPRGIAGLLVGLFRARLPPGSAQDGGPGGGRGGGPGSRSESEGLRGIAVLLVVLFHAGLPIPGGFIGVDVFFVISGFLITGLLVREHERPGRVSLSNFYARRVRRLPPAAAGGVLVTLGGAPALWGRAAAGAGSEQS